jgi:hypothetical protein
VKTKKIAILKKLTYTIVLLLAICLSGYSQVNGVDLKKSKSLKKNSGAFKNYEELINYNGEYCITYPLAPIGLQHCMDKLENLLSVNKLEWDKTLVDKTILAKNVNENLRDYVPLHQSLQENSSEVNKTWILQNGWYISLNCTPKAYTIWFIHPKDK